LISPDAFRIRKIRMAIETSTSSPTRISLRLTDLLVFGIAAIQRRKEEGGRMNGAAFIATFSSFVLHPSSFL
jgi:hypothetical protein